MPTHMALILSFSFSSKDFASKTHSFKTDENWGKEHVATELLPLGGLGFPPGLICQLLTWNTSF